LTFWSNCETHLALAIVSNFDGRLRVILERLASRNISPRFRLKRDWRGQTRSGNFRRALEFLESNRATLCMLAMIPSAIGGPRLTPACRFLN